MKKRILVLAMAATMMFSATSVFATEMSNLTPEGDVDVTAKVSNGAVSYVVSIPEAVDFGTLTQPADNTAANIVQKPIVVEATELTGLSVGNKLVVLVQDEVNRAENGFFITGQDNSNSGKKLSYDIVNIDSKSISDGSLYPNGYLMCVFSNAKEQLEFNLNLDQNQLYGVDLNSYAGSYKGTLSFYSKIASATEYVNN